MHACIQTAFRDNFEPKYITAIVHSYCLQLLFTAFLGRLGTQSTPLHRHLHHFRSRLYYHHRHLRSDLHHHLFWTHLHYHHHRHKRALPSPLILSAHRSSPSSWLLRHGMKLAIGHSFYVTDKTFSCSISSFIPVQYSSMDSCKYICCAQYISPLLLFKTFRSHIVVTVKTIITDPERMHTTYYDARLFFQ